MSDEHPPLTDNGKVWLDDVPASPEFVGPFGITATGGSVSSIDPGLWLGREYTPPPLFTRIRKNLQRRSLRIRWRIIYRVAHWLRIDLEEY